MKIEFVSGPLLPTTSPIAYVVNHDQFPASLESVVVEGAKASRFGGKAGQLHETFVSRDGVVARIAIAGAGAPNAQDRGAALEKAGAAITAKYLASGENTVTIDFAGAGLSASEVASVLLGARLRGWRYDKYRTTMPADQKATLTTVRVAGAPSGTEAAWSVEAGLADGIE
ncbi:MAG: leucyl aminopeptidase, partial [Sphingomonadales bacterium]|nr:leucyl aminopeptidase [Sphingomonadales bacterium]